MASTEPGDVAASLLSSFETLQQEHAQLTCERDSLQQHKADSERKAAMLQDQASSAQHEAVCLRERLEGEQVVVRNYVDMLATHAEAHEALEDGWRRDHAERDRARAHVQHLEQQLGLRDAELSAQKERLADVQKLGETVVSLQRSLAEAREREQKARHDLAPLQAERDLLTEKNLTLRDQLGKSENDRHRQVSELQQQLSSVSKQLRITKSSNEDLQRMMPPHGGPHTGYGGGGVRHHAYNHAQPARGPSMARAFQPHQNSVLFGSDM